jgi:cell pole-organizing protein PopZ
MNQPAKTQEPTMEEILASIRRIIADDDAGRAGPAKPDAAVEAADKDHDVEAMLNGSDEDAKDPPPADILELTESMRTSRPPPFQAVEGPPDVAFNDTPEASAPSQAPARPDTFSPDRGLLSARTSAAVDMAFNSLAHTVLVQNSRTLDDLVREMLKPMLKAWLDDNLPNMVERLVRAEIERVSRGRG